MSGTSRKNSGAGSSGEAAKAPQRQRRKTQPLVKQGDIAPDISPTGLRQFYVSEATARSAGSTAGCAQSDYGWTAAPET